MSGASVALSGETLVVGALRSEEGDGSWERVRFHSLNLDCSRPWKQQQKLRLEQRIQDDILARKLLSLERCHVVVGAYGENSQTGSVYVTLYA